MLGSIAFIILAGLCGSLLFKKIKLPGLIGMLLAGIIIGPGFLNILDDSILNISAYIRKIALIIILSRAGLGLDLDSLKKNGRPAFLLSFVPAAFELIVITIIGPVLFNISYIEAAILGTVLAAVSPAVIVPRMLKLKEEGYRDIPEMILAGASVDDIFVIVLFTSFTAMAKGDAVSILTYVNIPFSIVTGILIGIFSAFVLKGVYKYIKLDGVSKTHVMFGISLMLVSIEDKLNTVLTFSSLISIMVMGMALKRIDEGSAKQLGTVYNKLWIPGEIFLFVLVGAIADLSYIESIGLTALMLIVIGLIGRMMGTALCLVKTRFNPGERLFCMLSYLPKATVQASIGPLALAMGLECGSLVLSFAVLSIVFTAPLGAILIDKTYHKLLN
ncbi:MAG: cation:proton antiporter [Solobacterium sp.]|nr:cation:proton antiporter [Solobacterium sp.]